MRMQTTSMRTRLLKPYAPAVLSMLLLSAWPLLPTPSVDAAMPTAAPKAYIGLFKDNAVAVFDTQTNQVRTTIPVPPGPHGLVITPDGRKVYVSSDGASTVSVIDTTSDTVVGSIEVGPNPHGLTISSDGRAVLVSGFGANAILVIDTTNDRISGRVDVPMPHNSVLSPDGRMAYVGSQKQGETAIVIVDLAQQIETGRIPLAKTPRGLSLSADSRQLYVTLAGVNAIQVLDPIQHKTIGQIPVGASPHIALPLPHSTQGLVVSQGPGALELFDAERAMVSHTIAVGKAPHWVALSSDGQTAYVTNEGSNDLAVVDLLRHAVTAMVPVGNAPRKIALQAGTIPFQESAVTSMGMQAQSLVNNHGTVDVAGTTSLEIEADDSYFEPTFLRGTPGQHLQITLENEAGTLHNFSIAEQHIDVDIPPKGKKVVEVIFPPSGSLRFFCKIHEALGMQGALRAAPMP